MKYIIRFFVIGTSCSLLFPPFFLFPLGFLLLPYLYFSLIEKKQTELNSLKKFTNGFFFGLGLSLVVLNWAGEPLAFYSSTSNFTFLALLLNVYISLYFGLSFLLISLFKNNFSKLIMLPIIFVLAEILREFFLFGFPWLTFALIGSNNYYLFQHAYFVGTNGLSYLILILYLLPISFYYFNYKKENYFYKIYILFIFIILLIFLIFIFFRLFFNKENQNLSDKFNFSLNQINVSQYEKINNFSELKNIKEILEILDNNTNTINIFSETDYLNIIENHDIVNFFQEKLTDNNSIIIGGIRKENKDFYNTLYFINKNYFDFFDKKILVPFGEFLPFRENLKFLEPIVGKHDFKSGNKDRLIKFKDKFNFIPVICYEIIFFNDLITNKNHKSPLIINITNDAWFGDYSGPYQHFYLSRIRSIEYNKYLIRVSNNGITAIIDNFGNIIDYIPLNIKGEKKYSLKIPNYLNNMIKFHKLFYLFIIFLTILAIRIQYKFEKL